MTITKLKFDNLKGISFSAALAPATLIIGPNFSGKTAILDAIRIVFQGYIPDGGKTNAALYDLASGHELSIQAELSDGSERGRTLWKEGKSVRMDGTEPEPTPLLDGETYFGLSDAKRIDYVFSRVAMPETFTVAGIIARLQRLTFATEHTEEVEKAKADVIELCREAFQREFAPGSNEGHAVRRALAELTDVTLKEDFTRWNKQAADSIGTVRTLNELKNREGECSAETLTDLRNEDERLCGLHAEANQELGRLQAQADAAARTLSRRLDLTSRIEQPEPRRPEPTRRIVSLAPVPDAEPLIEELSLVIAELRKSESRDDKEARNTATEAARKWMTANNLKISTADAVAAIEDQLKVLSDQACCPHCKSKAKGWRKNVEEELTAKLSSAKEAFAAASKAEEAASEEQVRAGAAWEAITATNGVHRDLLDKRDNLTSRLERVEAEAERIKESNRHMQEEADRYFESAVKSAEQAGSLWAERLNAWRDELNRLEDTAAPTKDELTAAKAKVSQLDGEIGMVRDRIQAAERLQHDIRRASEAAQKHLLSVAKKDVIALVGKTLKAVKGEMVAEAFGKLLETANSIAGEILLSPLEYSADEGDIGRRSPVGRFIPHRTFSGTEKALAYAAISAALTSESSFRLLLLDELARLTPDVQDLALVAFRKAVDDGRLDQVIAVLPLPNGVGVSSHSAAASYSIIRTSLK